MSIYTAGLYSPLHHWLPASEKPKTAKTGSGAAAVSKVTA